MELNGEMFNIGLSSVTLKLQQKIAADVSDYAIDYPYSMSYNNSSTEFLEVNLAFNFNAVNIICVLIIISIAEL